MPRKELRAEFEHVRAQSQAMVEPLAAEDFRIQTMPTVSPPWWNLGHTSWFFARNLLNDETYDYELNSYYESLGKRVPQSERGKLTEPSTEDILKYRESVDARVKELIQSASDADYPEIKKIVRIGIEHEQQHQELFYTEIKNIYFSRPAELRPLYKEATPKLQDTQKLEFLEFADDVATFGNIEGGWSWDNELAAHKQCVSGYALANRLVTNGEYQAFIEDGGYRNPLFWLSDGWTLLQGEKWQAPLYWERDGSDWTLWTLAGQRKIDSNEPVSHISFYEAAAFAQWAATQSDYGAVRLPTEYEWEHAARQTQQDATRGNFLEEQILHPAAGTFDQGQLLGNAWEWTSSHYEAYPGYRPFQGALSEYNGKFMNNQRVLRGGSCVTPRSHIRISYRNFWTAETRFQFSGIRLAKDVT